MTETAIQTIGCPVCDAVYRLPADAAERSTRCRRCGHRLTFGRPAAIVRVVAVSATMLILSVMVLLLPFLELQAGQFNNKASVFDAILSFNSGIMVPLAIAVLGFILVLPLTRFLLFVYALGPLTLRQRNLPQATTALRWAFRLQPWAMAEIFMVGVAVALIKLAGMATIEMGPAFWALGAIVLLSAYQDTFMCRHTLWSALEGNA